MLWPAAALAGPLPQAAIIIPAQPLEQALMELARQGGGNILFQPGSMARLVSHPVHARQPAAALRQMIAGLPVRITRQHRGMAILPGLPGAALPARPPLRAPGGPARPQPAPLADQPVILVTAAPGASAFGSERRRPPRADDLLLAPALHPTDRNLAEAFGHAPGVLLLATNLQGDLGGIDRAGRAEGQFLAIRGLSGAHAAVRVDGVDLPESLPYGRDAELGMLSGLLFDKARIATTPGPQEAGDATSALVDLATPSAFAAGQGGLHLSASTDLDSQAIAYRQPATSWQAAARYSRRFGAGQDWGLALGATVSRRVFATVEQTYQSGTVELARVTAAGTSPAGINPASNLLLTDLNLEFTRGYTLATAFSGALEWRGASHFLALRALYATSHTEQDVYQLGFQGGNSAQDETLASLGNGISQITSTTARLHYWYQTNPQSSRLGLVQLAAGGESPAGTGTLGWQGRLYRAEGITARPR
ncbi:MAG TPA: hypothetical protein VFF98_15680, partial [Novosphingobium sp.]|nr:hypothetical protein [Novosphingobium sp.]